MEKLKVSIIIPIYNAEKYLEKCLDSVVGQTYANLEIIMIDDGSTDSSYSICQCYAEHDDRIKLIHQKNAGISAVRNKGLELSTGDYIFFIDSDDWIDADTISVLVDIAIKEDADMVASHYVMRATDSTVGDNSNHDYVEYTARDFVYMMTKPAGVFCFPWSRLIRRSLFPADPFPVGMIFEDLLTMPGIVWNANKVIFVSSRFYYYRYTKTGLSHGKFSPRAMQEMDGYLKVVELGDEHSDWPIVRNGILFFLTKYYYYKWRVFIHGMDSKEYKNKYSGFAHEYLKRLLSFGHGM